MYTLSLNFALGSGLAGKTINARFKRVAGAALVDYAAAGFANPATGSVYEVGAGLYYAELAVPDGFRGVLVFVDAADATIYAGFAVDPNGAEGTVLHAAGLDNVLVEAGINLRQWAALVGAVLAGKAVPGTNTMTYYAMGTPGTARVTGTTGTAGARDAITYTKPA